MNAIDDTHAEYWRLMVRQDGPRAAAWLVRRCRRKFLPMHAVRFIMPPRTHEQWRWSALAIDYLKTRGPKWMVIRRDMPDGRTAYTVVWMGSRARPNQTKGGSA